MTGDELLAQMDGKVAAGVAAESFWVNELRDGAYIRFSDKTEVGPLAYGVFWGPNADRDLCRKLGGRLFRWGLGRGATAAQLAELLCCQSSDGYLNQVFPCDWPELWTRETAESESES